MAARLQLMVTLIFSVSLMPFVIHLLVYKPRQDYAVFLDHHHYHLPRLRQLQQQEAQQDHSSRPSAAEDKMRKEGENKRTDEQIAILNVEKQLMQAIKMQQRGQDREDLQQQPDVKSGQRNSQQRAQLKQQPLKQPAQSQQGKQKQIVQYFTKDVRGDGQKNMHIQQKNSQQGIQNMQYLQQNMHHWQHQAPHSAEDGLGYQQARKSLQGKQQQGDASVQNNPLQDATGHRDKKFATNTSAASKSAFPYRYLINEPYACQQEINIINMIPIAPNQTAIRAMIRNLWGDKRYSALTGMRTMFVLGTTNSSRYQSHIQEESQQYHDIIQLDFVDSYRNLTLKTLTMLHWSLTFCPSAKWILKSDADVFVNPFALKNYLQKYSKLNLICRMNKNSTVCRLGEDCDQRWAVLYSEYPNQKYPPYCNGPAYIMASTIALQIYQAVNKTHPFFVEDAYYTGIIAKAFSPKARSFHFIRFPEHSYCIRKYLWDGFSLLVLDLEVKKKGSSYYVWNKILQYNNVTKAIKRPRAPPVVQKNMPP